MASDGAHALPASSMQHCMLFQSIVTIISFLKRKMDIKPCCWSVGAAPGSAGTHSSTAAAADAYIEHEHISSFLT